MSLFLDSDKGGILLLCFSICEAGGGGCDKGQRVEEVNMVRLT